jgi:hypothetical protein
MGKSDDGPRKQQAPYVSFKTFLGFIRKTKETIVPDEIDADVLRSYPGSTARQLKAALRFFDLMDDDDKTLPGLGALAAALDTDQWQPTFGKMVGAAYGPIIGDLPIERTTRVQMEGRFREYQSAEKEVLEKIVSFYVAALVSAGVKVSPLVTERAKIRPNGKPRRRSGQPDSDGEDEQDSEAATMTGDTMRFMIPFRDRAALTLTLPKTLTLDDWGIVDRMMRVYLGETK